MQKRRIEKYDKRLISKMKALGVKREEIIEIIEMIEKGWIDE
jgi:DNA-binding transcriptional regulator YhcF (GntR family)